MMKNPLLIGIAASNSGAGKTTLACAILEHYTSSCTSEGGRWGAIKYTRTASKPAVTANRAIIKEPGKDTARLLASGAAGVLWVRSSRTGLAAVLPGALKRLSSCEVIVVEGNGAIEFLKPDIVVFIFGKDPKNWKPGIRDIAASADMLVCEGACKHEADAMNRRTFQVFSEARERKRFFRALTGLLNERKREGRDDQEGGRGKAPLRRGPQAR